MLNLLPGSLRTALTGALLVGAFSVIMLGGGPMPPAQAAPGAANVTQHASNFSSVALDDAHPTESPEATEPPQATEPGEATEPPETTRAPKPSETEEPGHTPVPTATRHPSPEPSDDVPGQRTRFFPQTGHSVKGLFLDYWEGHGKLPQQGYPISPIVREPSSVNWNGSTNVPPGTRTIDKQYFERSVLEYHPENRPPYNVLLSLLGAARYHAKYPHGAPNQVPPGHDGHYFAETGHWVSGMFWDYWQAHGGLMQQGYPLSDPFVEKSDLDGNTYTVQYFERAVFEYHPENQPPYEVLLVQLGTLQYRQNHGQR